MIGPDILGKATTELSNGLLAKIQGTGSIDFTKIGQILLFCAGTVSAEYSVQLCAGLVDDRCHTESLLPHAE